MNYLYSKFSDFEEVHEYKNNYPKYDVLNIYKHYDFKLINQLHHQINKMIELMNDLLNNKTNTLNDHKKKFFIGLNIDNFVNTYHSEINKIENQIDLFKTYLKFFKDVYYENKDEDVDEDEKETNSINEVLEMNEMFTNDINVNNKN